MSASTTAPREPSEGRGCGDEKLAESDSEHRLRFVIVGTPRSGTTLVQRLLSEIPGVCVPVETHFFTELLPHIRQRGLEFPLSPEQLAPILQEHAGVWIPSLDVTRFVDSLGSQVNSPWRLFECLTVSLAGDAEIVGEKTPAHLRSWRPISQNFPTLRFIWILRDPRAVVSSLQKMPWSGGSIAVLANRWAGDVMSGLQMNEHLGPGRCFVLRFEELLEEPESTLDTLYTFLGLDNTTRPGTAAAEMQGSGSLEALFDTSEWWKAKAVKSPDLSRVSAWREEMDPRDVALVELVCRGAMRDVGYVRSQLPLSSRVRTAMPTLRSARLLARGTTRRAYLRRSIRNASKRTPPSRGDPLR